MCNVARRDHRATGFGEVSLIYLHWPRTDEVTARHSVVSFSLSPSLSSGSHRRVSLSSIISHYSHSFSCNLLCFVCELHYRPETLSLFFLEQLIHCPPLEPVSSSSLLGKCFLSGNVVSFKTLYSFLFTALPLALTPLLMSQFAVSGQARAKDCNTLSGRQWPLPGWLPCHRLPATLLCIPFFSSFLVCVSPLFSGIPPGPRVNTYCSFAPTFSSLSNELHC